MYRSRINNVLAFINDNLDAELTIPQLADVANFSPFHFQRIYKSLQSETPYDTILRLRLEKSVFLLKHRPQQTITDVAFECGFASVENFSRQFKKRFGHSPSAFKRDPALQKSRIYQEPNEYDPYHVILESRELPGPDFEVRIEQLPDIRIGFIRALFGEDGTAIVAAYNRLIEWAERNALPVHGPLRRFGMSVDDQGVTPAGLYRYDCAVALKGQENPALEGLAEGESSDGESGEIEFGVIPEGEYATLHCSGDITVVAQAWDHLYRSWLPESGYVPRHYPAIEEFLKGPEEIGWETFDLNCRVPIERMR